MSEIHTCRSCLAPVAVAPIRCAACSGHQDPESRHHNRSLNELQMETHRLSELVRAADIVHIRLRAGLRTAIAEIEEHAREYQHVTKPGTLAELRKLVRR